MSKPKSKTPDTYVLTHSVTVTTTICGEDMNLSLSPGTYAVVDDDAIQLDAIPVARKLRRSFLTAVVLPAVERLQAATTASLASTQEVDAAPAPTPVAQTEASSPRD